MDNTLKAKEFREIFQNSLKSTARSMSVKTLLSERNLKRIDYSPYYQRNYVWDNTKQTFFIESVILGTEIPPLILFKSGAKIEVIDGRQRFETLKRFKENDFTLQISGLKELKILNKLSFNKLSDENQEIFLNSNIRVFEFEVINHPNLDEQLIDRIKKEIFRRYNTGITPLTREELDNAKYDEDKFTELFKRKLKDDFIFLKRFNQCFFPKEVLVEGNNNNEVITKNADFIRRFRILNTFPIVTFAGSERTEIFDLLYDFAIENSEDEISEFESFFEILNYVLEIFEDMSSISILSNKLIYECILWAITILRKEDQLFKYNSELFRKHYKENISIYSNENSFYYRNIIERFSNTAILFEELFKVDYSIYIKDETFRKKIGALKQTEVDAAKSIEDLSSLRLHKPNPISIPIDEVRGDLHSTRYLVRPSYQRQEKINEIKASSIIESILLGINLPPIFIYQRDEVKEVVDGQQRLLAIIGFLGKQYYNENGKLSHSKNNFFKLKGLKILTDLEGSNFNNLSQDQQDKILDFVLDIIMIEKSVSPEFDPVDLFIRLNYKPYPIKSNSFEMWNSTVNFEVIKKIKEVFALNREWFFLRELVDGKPDRMENEELITILAYISYQKSNEDMDDVIGFFLRKDRIICRLKNKKKLGDFLTNLDNVASEKQKFLDCIEKTNFLIKKFASLFDSFPNKDMINDFLNIRKAGNFRRSLQEFYLIWLVIDDACSENFTLQKLSMREDIRKLLTLFRNPSDTGINQTYFDDFVKTLNETIKKYMNKNKE